jgi:hypothetical protein
MGIVTEDQLLDLVKQTVVNPDRMADHGNRAILDRRFHIGTIRVEVEKVVKDRTASISDAYCIGKVSK